MTKFRIIYLVILVAFIACNNKSKKQEYSYNYFSQKLPADSAVIFGTGEISVEDRFEFGISFSPDGNHLIYGVQQSASEFGYLMYSKQIAGNWTKPEKILLTKGTMAGEMEAFFSPNNDYIYFAAYDTTWYSDIYRINALDFQSSKAEKLDTLINTGITFYPICTKNNKLFYADVFKSKTFIADLNQNPVTIEDPGFNMLGHTFVSPNESFVIIDEVVDTSNYQRDLFVKFKNIDGGWTKSIDLGQKVNTEYSETCPSLSPDGKYLFFSRYNDKNEKSDIYWISSKVIDDVRQ